VTPQSQLIDAETELTGFTAAATSSRETRIAPEELRAPIDGVVRSLVSFQVQVVAGARPAVPDRRSKGAVGRAYDYGDTDPAKLSTRQQPSPATPP